MNVRKIDQAIIQNQQPITKSDSQFQMQYQSQKKLKNLFYIMSKHTKKYFKNHPYFKVATQVSETIQEENRYIECRKRYNKKSIINQQRLKTQINFEPSRNKQVNKNNEFVSYPTQFGLQNTYKYLHDKSFLSKSEQRVSFETKRHNSLIRPAKTTKKYSKIQSDHEGESCQKNYMKNTAAYQSRSYSMLNHQKQDLSGSSGKLRFSHNGPGKAVQKKSCMFRISGKRNSFNLNHSRITNKLSGSVSLHESLLPSRRAMFNEPTETAKYNYQLPAKFEVCFIYGKRMKSLSQLPFREINLDILPFLINTFLKCKIRYKQMTQKQFQSIKSFMLKVLQSKRKPQNYEIKDIINIGTINGVIRFLQQFSQTGYEWIETVRYFFLVEDQNVLDYQLSKIKEQVARLISIKFDAEFGQKQLSIFNIDKRTWVLSFYDLLKGGKFLIGDDSNLLSDYQNIQNHHFQQRSFQIKIKKWKGIASPQSENQSLVRRTDGPKNIQQKINSSSNTSSMKKVIYSTDKKLSEQKFNNLFQLFKFRQMKRMSKNLSAASNAVILKSNHTFVERSKLRKEPDIFQ